MSLRIIILWCAYVPRLFTRRYDYRSGLAINKPLDACEHTQLGIEPWTCDTKDGMSIRLMSIRNMTIGYADAPGFKSPLGRLRYCLRHRGGWTLERPNPWALSTAHYHLEYPRILILCLPVSFFRKGRHQDNWQDKDRRCHKTADISGNVSFRQAPPSQYHPALRGRFSRFLTFESMYENSP